MLAIFIVVAISPSYALRFRPRPTPRKSTRPPIWVPTTPPSAPSIPRKRCWRILDKPPSSLKKFREHGPVCVRLNEAQLLQRLKDVGGWNPRYVATNKTEACKFADLSVADVQPLKRGQSNHSQVRQKRMVSRRSGSVVRGCWSRGSTVDRSSLKRLCTECASTTHLPAKIFPRFINEVICGDADHFCYRQIGLCRQKVIKFTFLRFTGQYQRDDVLSSTVGSDVFVEQTQTFQQDIRSCCECRLFSFFGAGR